MDVMEGDRLIDVRLEHPKKRNLSMDVMEGGTLETGTSIKGTIGNGCDGWW